MDETVPPAEYPLEDWLNDYKWFSQETEKHAPNSASMGIEHFEDYFYKSRPEAQVADYCLKRFVAAMAYLEENIHAIDFGRFAVVGEERFMVHRKVVITLWRFFAARPEEDVNMPIPIDVFISELQN